MKNSGREIEARMASNREPDFSQTSFSAATLAATVPQGPQIKCTFTLGTFRLKSIRKASVFIDLKGYR
ncbi:hypothetical protein VCHA37P191_240074 [Vibrio chagasii]|nr:hypothetical protein VCHA34P115_20397 [Vibrio chagasii]CAH6905673.1 hypothetical protein VCHA36O157_30075 [Vibrio chagasii]CAH7165168.1 hypothetical protein VCHA37P191_240074 [Vibrio chagasii]CAH7255994.1 hypothetical protein VCHA43O270_30212 [Vibrio chagasii]CAH7259482.1 hypothetical protein VCHA41O245_180036 [Vibrio chagasii]